MATPAPELAPPFKILSVCKGGGYRYCRTEPPHPRRNAKGLYPLHRVLAENLLGRLLAPGEVVHHRDEDKANDQTPNLEVTSNAEHTRRHKVIDAVSVPCGRCGVVVTVKPHSLRQRQARSKTGKVFCSRSCGGFGGRSA